MAKNLCGKTRPKENPYEIWMSRDGFEYRVLKKYQSPENEAKNPHARWFLATKSPFTYGTFELGDGYVQDVKFAAHKLTAQEMAEHLINQVRKLES